MKKVLSGLIFFIFFAGGLSGQMIKIGLYNHELVTSAVIYCTNGEYIIKSGTERIGEFKKGEILFINLKNGLLDLHNSSRIFGSFEIIELKSLSLNGTLRVRPVNPSLHSKVYDDELLLESGTEYLTIINRVDFDKYIAGVLETEMGPNAKPELYKAHALLSRTYMLNNFDRHQEEGFSLCDGVHCQAYHGRSIYNPDIAISVFETSGEVVADYHYKLINAVYHSNSGGETQRASDVWLKDIDYLQAVMDPYSLDQPHDKWYDTINFTDWKDYLIDNGMKSADKLPKEVLYVQQRHRKKYFALDQDSLLMTKIRKDWEFNSTFFNMFPLASGKIVIWGKGYGHGVGLSQEGAANMAEQGLNYKDIIKFYFYNVRIMDYQDLPQSSLPDLNQ